MRKRIVSIFMILCVLIANTPFLACAAIQEDEVFIDREAWLLSNKSLSIYLTTHNPVAYIKIDSCKLQEKIGNTWSSGTNLSTPSRKNGPTDFYSATIDYSSNIGSGTYRIKIVINGGGYTKTIYSNQMTF